MRKVDLIHPVFVEYSRKGQQAVNFLLQKKTGIVPNALYNKNIGWIDLVWGYIDTKGKRSSFGLAKIEKYHKEVLPNLSDILKNLPLKSKSNNRIILEDKKYRAVISLASFEGENQWLLTAFEFKKIVSR